VDDIRTAILNDDLAGIGDLPVPDTYRAAVVRAEEAEMFEGMDSRDKDPRKSLHVQEVATPELGPGEAIVVVMASAINYNTVWTSIFEPVPTFGFLKRYAKSSSLAAKHDLPYHVVGSDLAGVVLRVGPGVTKWKPGDEVVAHCLSVELEDPQGHDDTMMDPQQRIWGFETNFGGLAELALVKSNQLMPKPGHLTWEEAAAPGLVNSTAYRQLVSHHGAAMKQGDTVLIWGASGGLGGYATQYALNGGATPVCVVSSPEKAAICRSMGADLIIDRNAEGYEFWKDGVQQPSEWKRLGARIRELTGGDDPDIVFEHPGRETFGASVYVTKRGGTIVTCASTSGYWHEYDNRYLWMTLKRIVGSHFANYRESWEANRIIARGAIHPTLSKAYPLDEVGQAAADVHRNLHQGKVGVLCLAPSEGLGVRDAELRAQHVDEINRFRDQ
jgi:crotonyl-CoA reductase